MFFGKRFRGYQTNSLSGLELLVLKLIQNRDGITGYEITQRINRKFKGLWRGSAGTIYPLLNKLVGDNLVEVFEIKENNRLKKKHKITQKGKDELKNVLTKYLQPNVNSLMDFINTMITDIPRVKHNVETMFCSFPHHRQIKIDKSDLSLSNIQHIKEFIKRLEASKTELKQRIERITNQIVKHQSLLAKIEEDREKESKPIDIFSDDMYS